MTKFLRNELTNDNVGATSEDQQDNIGNIFRILRRESWINNNNTCENCLTTL